MLKSNSVIVHFLDQKLWHNITNEINVNQR
ncbi:hypothetical protein PSEUDO9AZ_40180 [Pseudomonas sp. 9AZ]|nr:hypothetical protein PSEUDO9AZ_40180 [Pseudomonas sp. 9AZ]